MRHKGLLIAGACLAALVVLAFWARRHVVVSVQLRSDVPVSIDDPVTIEATVDGPVPVVDLEATVSGEATVSPIAASVDQVVRIPLNLLLDVPLEAKVLVDEVIKVRTTVPVDMVITEKELDLSRLEIPIDDSVYVDDVILVDTVVAIDSTAETIAGIEVPVKMNVPVKLRVPIKQKVRVRDKLVVGLKSFRLPFHVDLPVNADVPFKQELTVSGKARVPVRQVAAVRLKETLQVTVPGKVPVGARVKGTATGRIGVPIRVTADLGEGVRARVGEIRVDASEVDVQRGAGGKD
jgi:hypothetical protein